MTKKAKKTRSAAEEVRQAERDAMDESQWDEIPVELIETSKSPSIVFSLRFTPAELADLRREAEAWDLPLSTMIKKAALQWAREKSLDITLIAGTSAATASSDTRAPCGVMFRRIEEETYGSAELH